MKNYFKYNILLFLGAITTSCQDVVDVSLPEAESRLVVEASIDWEKGTLGNEQTIKLSMSKPYFDATTNTAVIGASVKITNDLNGIEFIFTDQNNGLYTTTSFVPVLNQSYTLQIINNGEIFTAHEVLTPVVDIQSIAQSVEGGYDNQALDVNVFFNDPANETNYYLIKFKEQGDNFPTLFDIKDKFTNGNLMSVFFEKRNDEQSNESEFTPGDVVDISLHGISQQYYNYIHILIQQIENGGGIFSSTPTQVKGNCINQANPNNYAFGYFRLTEVVKTSYTFQ